MLQGAGFKAPPIHPLHMGHGKSALAQLNYLARHNLTGFIGRFVEHLNFQLVGRIIKRRHRVQQPLGNVHLII